MVQVFATRVWGADFSTWPIMTFGAPGYRTRFIEERAKPGDLICLVATRHKRVAEDERGKLLAIAECALVPLDAETVLEPLGGLKSHFYTKDDKLRWAYAIPYTRAWLFDEPRKIKDVIGRELTRESTRSAEILNAREARAVLARSRHEVGLPKILPPEGSQGKAQPAGGGQGQTSKGPPPTIGGFVITRDRKPSSVYILRFENTNIFKIGWAFDVTQRLSDINKHIPYEKLNMKWRLLGVAPFADQYEAYDAEQALLKQLTRYRTEGERVRMPLEKMRAAWKAFSEAR